MYSHLFSCISVLLGFRKLSTEICFLRHINVTTDVYDSNRPRSIYQYSKMAPRLSGPTSIFGGVFFVSKFVLAIVKQKKLKKISNFDPKASDPC